MSNEKPKKGRQPGRAFIVRQPKAKAKASKTKQSAKGGGGADSENRAQT